MHEVSTMVLALAMAPEGLQAPETAMTFDLPASRHVNHPWHEVSADMR
jgi:hypothetical protein